MTQRALGSWVGMRGRWRTLIRADSGVGLWINRPATGQRRPRHRVGPGCQPYCQPFLVLPAVFRPFRTRSDRRISNEYRI